MRLGARLKRLMRRANPARLYLIDEAASRATCATRRTFVSTSLQEGQAKTSCSGRTPSLGIVRTFFMVSPQQRHTRVGELSGTGAKAQTERVLVACLLSHLYLTSS
jgi:hypothetical protein